jgi:hypothetical protein
MATEIPPASQFTGLTRKVLEYGERFEAIVAKAKRGLTDADWATIETAVDVANFQRVGRFLTEETEIIDWPTYRGYITKYGGYTDYDAKLRRITEGSNVVIQELEERNTANGVTNISNTVSIFAFSPAGLITHLDIYVARLGERPAIAQ